MSSKTKIVVLHMKEIIYTAIFIALGILFIILLAVMFSPNKKEVEATTTCYTPGVYTSSFSLNNTNLELEVVVDRSHINAIRVNNLDESIATMYPLIEPTVEQLAEQIYQEQSLENISYSEESPYTSQVLLNAIAKALEKASE